MAVSIKLGVLFVRVVTMRVLLCAICIRVPDFWKLPGGSTFDRSPWLRIRNSFPRAG